jgi:hypothetical protein
MGVGARSHWPAFVRPLPTDTHISALVELFKLSAESLSAVQRYVLPLGAVTVFMGLATLVIGTRGSSSPSFLSSSFSFPTPLRAHFLPHSYTLLTHANLKSTPMTTRRHPVLRHPARVTSGPVPRRPHYDHLRLRRLGNHHVRRLRRPRWRLLRRPMNLDSTT